MIKDKKYFQNEINELKINFEFLNYYKSNIIDDIQNNIQEINCKNIINFINVEEFKKLCNILKKYKNNIFTFENSEVYEDVINKLLSGENYKNFFEDDICINIYLDGLEEYEKELLFYYHHGIN